MLPSVQGADGLIPKQKSIYPYVGVVTYILRLQHARVQNVKRLFRTILRISLISKCVGVVPYRLKNDALILKHAVDIEHGIKGQKQGWTFVGLVMITSHR